MWRFGGHARTIVLVTIVGMWPAWAVSLCPAQGAARKETRDVSDSAGQVALQLAYEHVQEGYSLVERRAVCFARIKFTRALRLIAEMHDAREGTLEHSRALEEGLRGLRRADQLAKQESVEGIQERLYEIQQALVSSVEREPVGSLALCALGRMEVAAFGETETPSSLAGPKAVILHQAALAVDPTNIVAANELGVLLTRYGRWEDAESVFQHALAISPRPELWQNLSVVYGKMGRTEAAERVKAKGQAMTASSRQGSSQANAANPNNCATLVAWVEPVDFVERSAATSDMELPVPKKAPAAQPLPTEKSSKSKPGFSLIPEWISQGFKK